jgi:hypothetical protein
MHSRGHTFMHTFFRRSLDVDPRRSALVPFVVAWLALSFEFCALLRLFWGIGYIAVVTKVVSRSLILVSVVL